MSKFSARRRNGRASWRGPAAIGLLLLPILLLRLPLWLLPGPGRDEAAYYYWSHHFEPAYSPLMQWSVRLFEVAQPHSLFALRAPVALMALLALWLCDLRLRRVGAGPGTRLLAALAIALTPWQSFTGSILHPDTFLLVALLAFALAAARGKVLLCALAAWCALLAKPTGVLLLPVAWWMAGRLDCAGKWRVAASRALLAVALLLFLLSMKTAMVEGIADFGRMAGTVSPLARLGAGGLALIFQGGPLLIGLALLGMRERVRLLREGMDGPRRREAEAVLGAAAVMILFFLSAALLRGQFKANWILPALVLTLPIAAVRAPRALIFAGVAFAFLASIGQTVALRRPELAGRVEASLATLFDDPGAYHVHAGVREREVSSSRTWEHHLAQYEDASGFAREVTTAWQSYRGPGTSPAWIVSDDYGLAAQLHWYLCDENCRLVIPEDGIFHRTVNPLLAAPHPTELLLLPVGAQAESLWDGIGIVENLPGVRHPVTGEILDLRAAGYNRVDEYNGGE